MKKTIKLITATCLLVCLLLTACGPANTDNNSGSSSTTVPSSGVVQGGVEDNIVFDDEPPINDTSKPSTGTSVPSSTAPSTQATQASKPATQPETQPSTTQPTTPTTKPVTTLTYEQFQAMTGAEQRAYQESFESIDAFFVWYNAAKETYEQENPPIEIGGDGTVVLPTD